MFWYAFMNASNSANSLIGPLSLTLTHLISRTQRTPNKLHEISWALAIAVEAVGFIAVSLPDDYRMRLTDSSQLVNDFGYCGHRKSLIRINFRHEICLHICC